MNDLCNHLDLAIANPKLFAQGFESAILTPMSKAAALEHVKRHRIGMPRGIAVENELGVLVDEAGNQPCRRNAIDPRAGPRDPRPVQIFLPDTQRLPRRLRDWILDFFGPGQQSFYSTAEWAVEIVDG